MIQAGGTILEEKNTLEGKRILIVDDEPDILVTLEGLLDECDVDTASDFQTAKALLDRKTFDAAILDIMGVRGYEILEITTGKNIPTLMLTAHALSPEDLVTSLKKGALAYVPKDRISEIEFFLEDILKAHEQEEKKPGKWFSRLEHYFEKKFGADWRDKTDPEFWKKLHYM
jgi:DNA-binding response OmpR family regulator